MDPDPSPRFNGLHSLLFRNIRRRTSTTWACYIVISREDTTKFRGCSPGVSRAVELRFSVMIIFGGARMANVAANFDGLYR